MARRDAMVSDRLEILARENPAAAGAGAAAGAHGAHGANGAAGAKGAKADGGGFSAARIAELGKAAHRATVELPKLTEQLRARAAEFEAAHGGAPLVWHGARVDAALAATEADFTRRRHAAKADRFQRKAQHIASKAGAGASGGLLPAAGSPGGAMSPGANGAAAGRKPRSPGGSSSGGAPSPGSAASSFPPSNGVSM